MNLSTHSIGDSSWTFKNSQLDERGSILDTLLDDTRQFRINLGRDDQARLDQYLTSVREIEERLHVARQWELRPKPTPIISR